MVLQIAKPHYYYLLLYCHYDATKPNMNKIAQSHPLRCFHIINLKL